MDSTIESTSQPHRDEEMDVDEELTNKFLSGEMSFAEYSSEWYRPEDEEDLEDIGRNGEETINSVQVVEKSLQKRRRRTRLSAALVGLMGEANIRFARGDLDMAERMCHEIIKQLPTAAEPYQTLAQIYEHDVDKSLQFSLLAAHLTRSDAEEWWRLAAICKQRDDKKQEMICYTQAIKSEPQNLDAHMKRLEFITTLEEMKYPVNTLNVTRVKCYHKIVTSLPSSEGETIMKYAKLAVTLYHNSEEIERACEVMSTAYKQCSSIFTIEDINIYLELLISLKQYHTCIDVFVSSIGVEIEAEIQTIKNASGEIEEHTNYLSCIIPSKMAIDLKSKLLVCFIHLGSLSLVETLLNDFLSNDVDKAGDLYMDIEEAFSSVGHYEMAIKLLEPLVRNTNFDLGAVWLKHAECLYKLGRVDDAIDSYYKVLRHVPQHPNARKKLFCILEKKGCIEDALNILQQDYKYVVSANLLYEQCQALKKYNKPLKYLEVGEALLSRNLTKYRHREELNLTCRAKGGVDLIFNFRKMRGENTYHEDDIQFDDEKTFKFNPKEEFALFKELIEIACQHRLYPTMQRITFLGLLSKGLSSHRTDVGFYCLQACLLNNDFQNALRFVKEYAVKYPSLKTYNLLSYVINSLDENTHGKFLSRLFQKDYNIVKHLFLGNNFLISGRYLVALKYFLEYHNQCREPLSALLIAVTILAMAAQRTVDKHHNLILQGFAYLLTYKQLRKCEQEVNYNMGRAYQMLNINNLAIEYYERALACGPIATCSKHGVIDLTQEIAYNLYVMYKDQSPDIARRYMAKYLVI
ncbi:general transcription factor 3C polypeptide 3 [Maniola hyperantus]|uniref:general transcription factor 3C polypeptide 3 n=1 Tax=Aphantopus hyperantus TaxID=2795564 RepID=UPI002130A72F